MTGSALASLIYRLRRSSASGEGTGERLLLDRYVAQKDEGAFEELVHQHGPMVLGLCKRLRLQPHDADDVFQATFLIFARKAASIQGGAVGPWLYKVAYRAALEVQGQAARKRQRETPLLDQPAKGPTELADTQELLDRAINALPEHYRAAFVLCYLQELTHAEAGRLLGCPEGTIASRLSTAREKLRRWLGQRGIEPTVRSPLVPPALLAQALQPEAMSPGAQVLAQKVTQSMLLSKLKWLLPVLLLVGGLFLAAQGRPAQEDPPVVEKNSAEPAEVDALVTLYALDPIAHALSFRDGKPGGAISDKVNTNRSSDLDFHVYNKDSFSVGVEGDRIGTLIDLGTAVDLAKRYGYQETMGNGQGYASLHRKGDKVLILKDYEAQTYQEMSESADLFAKGKVSARAGVQLGHLYLARVTGGDGKSNERLARVLVVGYRPGEFVTIRWRRLD